MTLRELYADAVIYNLPPLILMIELLVTEKKALSMDDCASKLDYYMQDRFDKVMNENLNELNKKLKLIEN